MARRGGRFVQALVTGLLLGLLAIPATGCTSPDKPTARSNFATAMQMAVSDDEITRAAGWDGLVSWVRRDDGAAQKVLQKALHDPSRDRRAMYQGVLFAASQAPALALERAVESTDTDFAVEAAVSLCYLGNPAGRPLLTRMLTDDDPTYQRAAEDGLAELARHAAANK